MATDTAGPQSLASEENLALQRATWRFERAGWVSLAVLTVVALTGLTGAGPASHAVVASPDGAFAVGYDRFVRLGARTRLELRVPRAVGPASPAQAPAGELRVWVERGYLEAATPLAITPPPAVVEQHGPRLVYVFRVAPGVAPQAVTFELEPERAGFRHAALGIEGGAGVAFRQLVYP